MLATFMSRIVLALLAGAVVCLLAMLWREHGRTEALQAQLVETEKRLARTTSSESRRLPATPAESTVHTPPVGPPTSPANKAAAPAPRTFSDTERKLRKQIDEQRRWTALAKKADLLAALKLPPDKRAALKDLLAERDYVEGDARDAARAAGVEPHAAAAAELAKVDARIQALLGESDYASYTEQMSITVFREQLEGSPIPGSLVDAGTPLASEQKDWIARVMYRAFGMQLTDRPAQSPDPDAARRAFAATVLAEAPGNLTPPQIAALREYFRKDDELAAHVNTLIREQSQRK
jgi:hypothetical protein